MWYGSDNIDLMTGVSDIFTGSYKTLPRCLAEMLLRNGSDGKVYRRDDIDIKDREKRKMLGTDDRVATEFVLMFRELGIRGKWERINNHRGEKIRSGRTWKGAVLGPNCELITNVAQNLICGFINAFMYTSPISLVWEDTGRRNADTEPLRARPLPPRSVVRMESLVGAASARL